MPGNRDMTEKDHIQPDIHGVLFQVALADSKGLGLLS